MASGGKKLGLALVVLVVVLSHGVAAQSGCSTVVMSLAPCLNYVTGNSSTPSSSCCSQLANVVQTQPKCLCSVLNGGGSSLGISINQTLAVQLPGACNVQTPPSSQCNGGNGPATSTESPPADSSDDPTASSSVPSIPSGTGSKTVPGTNGSISSGNIQKTPIYFTFFILFLTSRVSKLY